MSLFSLDDKGFEDPEVLGDLRYVRYLNLKVVSFDVEPSTSLAFSNLCWVVFFLFLLLVELRSQICAFEGMTGRINLMSYRSSPECMMFLTSEIIVWWMALDNLCYLFWTVVVYEIFESDSIRHIRSTLRSTRHEWRALVMRERRRSSDWLLLGLL